MSISSEITRLQNDSTAIASAIAAKGVTVPSGSGYDDYATLIASIPTGGSTVNIATTSASGSSGVSQSFSNLLGEPKLFAIQFGALDSTDGTYLTPNANRAITSIIYNGTTVYSSCAYRSGSTNREYLYKTCTFTYSNNTLTVTSPGASTAGEFRSGTYKLIYVY